MDEFVPVLDVVRLLEDEELFEPSEMTADSEWLALFLVTSISTAVEKD